MVIGLFLIFSGVFIYLYPRVIVAMISGVMIAAGVIMILLHWRLRRMYRSPDQASNRWMCFLFRF